MSMVTYCDFCDSAIKGTVICIQTSEYYEEDTIDTNSEASNQHYKKKGYRTKEYEVCPTCKELIDEMFKLRRQNITNINTELLAEYNLQPKSSPLEKKKRSK